MHNTRTLASVPGLENTVEHTVRLETREGWRLDDYALYVPEQPTVVACSDAKPEPFDAPLALVLLTWCLLGWIGLAMAAAWVIRMVGL